LLARALNDNVVEVIANAAFEASPRSNYDTEASAALLYIDAVLDVFDAQPRSLGPRASDGDSSARELVKDGVARLETLQQWGREAALRRLWYRLASTALRISPHLFDSATLHFELEPLLGVLREVGFPVHLLGEVGKQPVIVSAHLKNGNFRVPLVGNPSDGFGEWNDSLETVLRAIPTDLSDDTGTRPIQLAAGNEVIAAIRSIPLRKGVSVSSRGPGPLAQDFVHIGLRIPRHAGTLSAKRLTAIVIGHSKDGPTLLPAFASVSTALVSRFAVDDKALVPERCTIRINLAGSLVGEDKIDVFLVKGHLE
jgi:hypothetical protein